MTTRQYIKKELKLIEDECSKKHITPEEWIDKNAKYYHFKYARKVNGDQ